MTTLKATVYIHGGDYDCSEAERMCYRTADVLPYGCYCWTGNLVELFTEHGFVKRSLSSPKRGDVLWREGHTEMYLGDNLQGGARIDENGTIYGSTPGDQAGNEITKSAYRASDWTTLLRYEGGATVDGIPAAEVAAQVMEHLIDHAAHGYSQPNRSGDGTIEPVTITWDDGKAADPVFAKLSFHATFNQRTNIRSAPSLSAPKVSHFDKGDGWDMDGVAFGDGYVWATWIGRTTKRRLYAALGDTELAKVVVA